MTSIDGQHAAPPHIGQRLGRDLNAALFRLRQLRGAVAVEQLLGAIGDNSPFADQVDEIQANAGREMGFATRELLLERVNRLSAALDRVNDGEYGVCDQCAGTISPARLEALPEVQTCIYCQDSIERLGRHDDRSMRSVFPHELWARVRSSPRLPAAYRT